MASHHYLAYGNDINPTTTAAPGSFTHHGAADDCNQDDSFLCPGGVSNKAFGVTVMVSPLPTAHSAYYVALDTNGNLGLLTNPYAGAAIVAGAGAGNPEPGAIAEQWLASVLHRQLATGELLLGSSASSVRCDYGETSAGNLTCNSPLRSTSSAESSAGAVPPCYKNDGTPCNATFHLVKNSSSLNVTTNGACANNTSGAP